MQRFVFIIRGPVKGISKDEILASEQELEKIREWLKALKTTYQDMLFQKLGSQQEVLSESGLIENKISNLIDGGEISQILTLILPNFEEAQKIAQSFPFPNSFYSLELRELI
ncbi:MAG: hypothetical protein RJA76_1773 [Bacteroidota bacterium]|jgi:hypothetical protein